MPNSPRVPILSFEMGRIFLLTALFAAFTVPVALSADTPTDGTLSVKRGKGFVTLKLRGTVIGRLMNGRVQVRDFRPFDDNDPQLTGCRPRLRHPSLWLSVCQGRKIGFRVVDGRFNVVVRGTGISISAVGRGMVTIDGTGETGVNDGVMSVDEQAYESLPDDQTTFFLGTPPRVRG
jgi:hypothetical protein